MMPNKIFFYYLIILSFVFIIFSSSAQAKYDPDVEWHTQETEHFLFHYHDGLSLAVPHFIQHAEKIHTEISSFFHWQPSNKTHVILSDHFDNANGNAKIYPNNVIELYVTPPSSITGLEDFDDWRYLLFEHEYTHIIQLDMAADFPLHIRGILGRHWLLFPNQYLPKWIIEGIATYKETRRENGIGRGQSSYYRALMRNEVKNGIRSLYQVNQTQINWPSTTTRYLYGVYFFSFLEKTYGEKSITELMQAYSRFPVPYFINTVFKGIYKKDLYRLWDEFNRFLHAEFDPEIQQNRILQNNHYQISTVGFRSGFSRLLDNGDILFIQDQFDEIKSLVKYHPEDDSFKTLYRSVALRGSFDIDPQKGILVPMVDWVNSSRLVTDLYILDINGSSKKRITKNQRYILANWQPKSEHIIALKNQASIHSLDLLNADGQYIKSLWRGDKNEIISSFDFSPDGSQIVASIFRKNRGWNLEVFEIKTQQWHALTQNKHIESHPRYSKNGKHIIYIADYSKIYNVYELSLETLSTKQLTDSDSGILYPTYDLENNRIYFSELNSNGFNLNTQNLSNVDYFVNFPLIDDRKETNNLTTKLKHLPSTNYNALKYLNPRWWEPLPLVLNNSDQLTIGLLTSSFDPIQRHSYRLVAAYDIKNNVPLWSIQYTYARFLPEFTLNTSRINFYPSNTQLREERSSRVAVNLPLNHINNSWNLNTTLKRVNSQLYLRSNLARKLSNENDDIYSFGFSWRNTSRPFAAVNQHSGGIFSLNYEQNKISKPSKPFARYIINGVLYSPLILKSVIAIRTTHIYSGGQTRKLFVGGDKLTLFGSGSVGKRSYSLAGFSEGAFIGNSLQKYIVNFHIPIANPQRSLMSPPIGISRIVLIPFLQTARVGDFNQIKQSAWHSSLGAELNMKANFGYNLFPFTIKTGIAKGIGRDGNLTSFFMVLSEFI